MIISCNRIDKIQMEQSLKYIVFSVIVLLLNRSRFMKLLCWIIVLAVIYHCTVLHSYLLPYYCRNPYQSITLMQVNVKSALYNHHTNTKRILRVRMDCALNSNAVIFPFFVFIESILWLYFDYAALIFHRRIHKSHISNEYWSNYFNRIVVADSFHLSNSINRNSHNPYLFVEIV